MAILVPIIDRLPSPSKRPAMPLLAELVDILTHAAIDMAGSAGFPALDATPYTDALPTRFSTRTAAAARGFSFAGAFVAAQAAAPLPLRSQASLAPFASLRLAAQGQQFSLWPCHPLPGEGT